MNNLNISIDDVSPHPKSSTKVLERCFELIEFLTILNLPFLFRLLTGEQ